MLNDYSGQIIEETALLEKDYVSSLITGSRTEKEMKD